MTERSKIAEPLRSLRVKMDDLVLDPANVRRHPERNLEAIAGSLQRFGQDQPLVVQKQGMVIRKGNGRYEAAKRLGWKTIAALVVDESDIEATARAIADNRTGELAEWDDDGLAALLKTLEAEDTDLLAAAGYTDEELQAAIDAVTEPTEIVEDEAPPVPAEPVSQVGDVWVCGRHRLICGDSTSADVVDAVLDGAKPFIMVTDPPYGVNYDPKWRNAAVESGGLGFMPTQRTGDVQGDGEADWSVAYALFVGDVAYVWHASAKLVVGLNLDSAGFVIRSQIIWRKPRFAISRGHYHWQHEAAWYAVKSGKTAKWCGDRSQSTIWDIAPPGHDFGVEDVTTNHGTQKPVECMARPIRNHGGKDDHVYDPFIGSGTTIIAAEQLGRTCYGIEISPQYVDVVCQRFLNLTSESPVREQDGAVFADLVAARDGQAVANG